MNELTAIRAALAELQRSTGRVEGLLAGIARHNESQARRMEEMEKEHARLARRVNIFHGIFLAIGTVLGFSAKDHLG